MDLVKYNKTLKNVYCLHVFYIEIKEIEILTIIIIEIEHKNVFII